MLRKNRDTKEYISGLKGLTCIFIVLGHYSGIYKYAQDVTVIENSFLRVITSFPISIISSESYWLYLFFTISGYLLGLSTMKTVVRLKDVLIKGTIRFLRFALPILGAAVMIGIIQEVIGFWNQEISGVVENQWLMASYQEKISVLDVLKEPIRVLFLGKSKVNSPFWCLKGMFISSIIIYIVTWIKDLLGKKLRYSASLIGVMAVVIFLIIGRYAILAHILGMVLAWNEKQLKELFGKFKAIYVVCCLTPLIAFGVGGHSAVLGIAFSLLILAVGNITLCRKILESKVIKFLGSVSWGIYAFHWPIYCSVGMLILLKLYGVLQNSILQIVIIGVCFLVTLVLAVISRETIEKITDIFCKKINRKFK